MYAIFVKIFTFRRKKVTLKASWNCQFFYYYWVGTDLCVCPFLGEGALLGSYDTTGLLCTGRIYLRQHDMPCPYLKAKYKGLIQTLYLAK